jgi:hypothetical protein
VHTAPADRDHRGSHTESDVGNQLGQLR